MSETHVKVIQSDIFYIRQLGTPSMDDDLQNLRGVIAQRPMVMDAVGRAVRLQDAMTDADAK